MEDNPIIVALDDIERIEDVKLLVKELAPHVGMFKVGLELMTHFGGPQVVELVRELGGEVFYDGKFNDIPNTMGKAAKWASRLGVKMFNVHANASPDSVKAAADNKGDAKLLVVTVLTSQSPADVWDMYVEPVICLERLPYAQEIKYAPEMENTIKSSLDDLVVDWATKALKNGADGIICSPQELEILNLHLPNLPSSLLITPGVRPIWAFANDQKRVMTPAKAIEAGTDYLVIGRPITAAKDRTPAQAAQDILREIQGA